MANGGIRNYFENCHINGTADFIFGAATAYFYNCTIESLSNSKITAASNAQQEKYGFVFVDCKLVAKNNKVNLVFLGRPWRPYAKTVLSTQKWASRLFPAVGMLGKATRIFSTKKKPFFMQNMQAKCEFQ